MEYLSKQGFLQFVKQSCPRTYHQLREIAGLDEYFWTNWVWMLSEQTIAAQEAVQDSPVTCPLQRQTLTNQAVLCAREISLEILQMELEQKIQHQETVPDIP